MRINEISGQKHKLSEPFVVPCKKSPMLTLLSPNPDTNVQDRGIQTYMHNQKQDTWTKKLTNPVSRCTNKTSNGSWILYLSWCIDGNEKNVTFVVKKWRRHNWNITKIRLHTCLCRCEQKNMVTVLKQNLKEIATSLENEAPWRAFRCPCKRECLASLNQNLPWYHGE